MERAVSFEKVKLDLKNLWDPDLLRRRVKRKELILFTTQLQLMLMTGNDLVQSLQALEEQTENRYFREVIRAVTLDVQQGQMLSSALSRHPKVFSQVFVSMIKAGEIGGVMSEILKQLASIQEREEKMLSAIKATLTYPLILMSFAILVVIFLVSFVLPRFVAIFRGMEDLLPLPTRVLLAVSSAFTSYWYLFFLGAVAVGWGGYLLLQKEQTQSLIDRFLIKLPVIQRSYRGLSIARIVRTLGVLLESGVPILEAMDVAKATVKSRLYRNLVERAKEAVMQGKIFSLAFSESAFVPPMVKQMLKTGEATGTAGMVMIRIGDFYDEEAQAQMKRLSTLLEPAIIIGMGVVVGFIVLSIILPIFRMSLALGR
jgi:type IV pilus assembly protein PilC